MIHLTPSLHTELHKLLFAPGQRRVYERYKRDRYVIELLPLSGWWRISDTLTGEYTDGTSGDVQIPIYVS